MRDKRKYEKTLETKNNLLIQGFFSTANEITVIEFIEKYSNFFLINKKFFQIYICIFHIKKNFALKKCNPITYMFISESQLCHKYYYIELETKVQ